MYPELKNKIALVTGGSRGFGRQICLRLAKEGCKVIVNFRRSMTEADETVEMIEKFGGEAVKLRADVGKPESLDKMFEQIKSEFGKLDIVVANAAFGVPGELMSAKDKYWDLTMGSSARSLLDLAHRAVPLMNGWGRIVSITSDGGQKVIPGYGLVGPAKAALESLTRGLAFELAGKGILVNGVLAGLADTKSARSIPGATDVMEHAKYHAPMGRLVDGKDISRIVAFLCSNESEMICGQFLVVDGGRNIVG